ncbi:D-erythronate dehydrogenase [Roseobacter sinensis]|uniref:SDR family oxidoreductase n=1 Tax=Roseobacter sinensis TaxID=2931391 RepID=A0ABT3B9Q4_9RHOB|nr:D-erythronate dehydrogenase [Roseobacter sp. WL0113]MCV3270287.1 SDR family oxidoreductase [Roseobacter sp. WL0113]
MTKVLIIGGGGMVGQKLLSRLLAEGLPGHETLEITLFDIGFPTSCPEEPARIAGNLTDPAKIAQLAGLRADLIYHLAAIVSGESETDFDKGWATNMMAMWHLLEALRSEHDASGGTYVPRVVFTSSIAVFGAPYPDKIGDEFLCSPQTSYGAQKAISELMLQDFSRKGFMDGMSLRLPTICVRPGKANLAASSFFSGIIREPLNGQEAVLPVPDTVRHWHASPKSAAGFLIHAATLDTARLEGRRALSLPGLSCTVAEQIEALRRAAGQKAVDLIKPQPDAAIMTIVAGWPRDFDPARATALGFKAETSFDEIVQTYIAEDLSG